MTNVRFASIDDYRDIETRNLYRMLVDERGMSPPTVHGHDPRQKSRDNARTPMQWDATQRRASPPARRGSRVNPNYVDINVEQARADPNSIFAYYQRLIQLRKQEPIVVYGTYTLLLAEHPQIYAFTRTLADDRLLVVLNFSAERPEWVLPSSVAFGASQVLIANYAVDPDEDPSRLTLRPYEARVYRLSPQLDSPKLRGTETTPT